MPLPNLLRQSTAEPLAVHLDAGRWERRASELAEYNSTSCGHMPNDWLAYGMRAPMQRYAALLPTGASWMRSIAQDPSVRPHRNYRPGVRQAGTWLDDQEGLLGYYLRAIGARCVLADVRGMRLCGWRAKLGHGAPARASRGGAAAPALGCGDVVFVSANVSDPARWCGKDSRTW